MDDLGDRMKGYEQAEAGRRFLPLLPICARIDGRSFSRWTDGLARPYDPRLTAMMVETTRWLVAETDAAIGYTQSDEISLAFVPDNPKRGVFFDGRIQKLVSVLAAMATARFNALIPSHLPERVGTMPVFDCRVWVVPNLQEAANTFVWRELDATKNSLSMAARHHHTHEEVHGRSGPELHDLLHARGVNWNDFPAAFKRGTYVQRREVRRRFTTAEVEALPPRHDARSNPDLEVVRTEVVALDLPPITRVANRVQVLFEGADPEPNPNP